MFKIKISSNARIQLKSITKKINRKVILEAIEDLQHDPFIGNELREELAGRYGYRIGVYRIIYNIYKKDKIVLVKKAGHRSVVYN